jgi:methyl-accepting chemotaxis protein
MSEKTGQAEVRQIIARIAVASLVIQAFFLFSSEFFNSYFNNYLDSLNYDLGMRVLFTFKPTIFIVFIAAYILQLSVTLATLRPLFAYLLRGDDYEQARSAAVKLPGRILLVQIGSWVLGLTGYYMLNSWQSDFAIPYGLGLLLKIGLGFEGAVYNCVVVNLILIKIKARLNIVDIKEGERDWFVRGKEFFTVAASAFLIVSHYSYLVYYFAKPHNTASSPLLALCLWGAGFLLVTSALTVLSKREYAIQVEHLKSSISNRVDLEGDRSQVQILYFDEIGEFGALFNQFLKRFQQLLDEILESARKLSDSVQDLSTTTKEVTSTSNMQAAAVKEVVSTMEDSNTITRSIGSSVSEVTRIALKTKEHVESGTALVQSTIDKMSEIRKKNTDTISGIRLLAERIKDIWGIVDIINSIVEQTRIIAFNASLEASTAGEAGRNFQIVASEIKRLADSTNDSTTEIQNRITEIQKAANNLIVVSEEGTERIRQGYELSDQLHEVFSEILTSADISATSSESIERSIRQQMSASEQILVTMKEISKGIENLAVTQLQTAHTTENLKATAEKLSSRAQQFSR